MCQNKEKIRLRSRVFAKLFAGQESTSPHICYMNSSNLLIDKWLLLIAFHFFPDVHAKPPPPALSDITEYVCKTNERFVDVTHIWPLVHVMWSIGKVRFLLTTGKTTATAAGALIISRARRKCRPDQLANWISRPKPMHADNGLPYISWNSTTVVNHDTDEITRRGWYAFDKNASTLHTQPCD